MTAINLADFYRTANLSPSHEIITLRTEPVKKAAAQITGEQSVDLVRYYYGLPRAQEATWLPELFRESDASFSLIENEREAAVLAAAILATSIGSGSPRPAVAVLAGSGGGLRAPLVCPQVVGQARDTLVSDAIERRNGALPDVRSIKAPGRTKTGASAAAAVVAQDWAKAGETLKLVSDENVKNIEALVSQTVSILTPLTSAIKELREEVQILWWHIGGWSRDLQKPFAEFPAETAAMLAGIDIAELSDAVRPPASSLVLLEKTLALGRETVPADCTFESAVMGLSVDQLAAIDLPASLTGIVDLCPIHTALLKAREIGGNGAWHQAFTKSTGLEPTAALSPICFAMQALRERLLTYCI